MDKVLFAGVDVDDKNFNICIVDEKGNIIYTLKSSPNAKSLAQTLKKNCKNYVVKICYEATYLGASLKRELNKLNLDCEIVAPTSIPKSPSQKVKTDRLDAIHLAKCYQKDLLSIVKVPSEDEEADRDLIRERQTLVKMATTLKRVILSKCRRCNWHYLQEENKRDYWTKHHRNWLDKQIKSSKPSAQISFRILLIQLMSLEDSIGTFDTEIKHLSTLPKYQKSVNALKCFKGIQTHTAMALVTEIVDINKFNHPKKLASYCGLDITEYSSGGKEYRYHITKAGNSRMLCI